jgi:hypothetical protein
MNDLFINKNSNANILWIKQLEINRSGYRQVAPTDIYMLCPQHDFLLQGSDVKRLINWISALQASTQQTVGCNNNLVRPKDGCFHRFVNFTQR